MRLSLFKGYKICRITIISFIYRNKLTTTNQKSEAWKIDWWELWKQTNERKTTGGMETKHQPERTEEKQSKPISEIPNEELSEKKLVTLFLLWLPIPSAYSSLLLGYYVRVDSTGHTCRKLNFQNYFNIYNAPDNDRKETRECRYTLFYANEINHINNKIRRYFLSYPNYFLQELEFEFMQQPCNRCNSYWKI